MDRFRTVHRFIQLTISGSHARLPELALQPSPHEATHHWPGRPPYGEFVGSWIEMEDMYETIE